MRQRPTHYAQVIHDGEVRYELPFDNKDAALGAAQDWLERKYKTGLPHRKPTYVEYAVVSEEGDLIWSKRTCHWSPY